jgi:hypothetical protein
MENNVWDNFHYAVLHCSHRVSASNNVLFVMKKDDEKGSRGEWASHWE